MLKARSQNRSRARGTNRSLIVAERSVTCRWSVDTGCIMSSMYDGANKTKVALATCCFLFLLFFLLFVSIKLELSWWGLTPLLCTRVQEMRSWCVIAFLAPTILEQWSVSLKVTAVTRPKCATAIQTNATVRWRRRRSVTWSSWPPCSSTWSLVTCRKPHLDAVAAAATAEVINSDKDDVLH